MRNNLKYFTFLFIFFIVVAFGSILILNDSGSVFDRSANTIGANQSALQDTITGTEPKNDEVMEEAIANEETNDTSDVEAALENLNATQEVSVEESEPVVEEAESVTEDEDQKQVEELVSELEETNEQAAVELKYYTYKIATEGSPLRLRDDANLDATIIAKINTGSHGNILKPGNVWCKVYTTSGKTGYLATEYLIIDEVTKEDFPEEIRDKVEAPDETLGSAFEGNG